MIVFVDASVDERVVGLAWVIQHSGSTHSGTKHIYRDHTSVEAEFFAVIEGLRHAKQYEDNYVVLFTDCQPVIEKLEQARSLQTESESTDSVRLNDEYVSRKWEKRSKSCTRLCEKFESCELRWKPRESNQDADRLAYEALERGRRKLS